jgi:hypothetical protein
MVDHKIFTLDLPNSTRCVLKIEANEQVFHFNDDYHDAAFRDSGIFDKLTALVTAAPFRGNGVIETMRNDGLLDEYQRGTFDFESYVYEKMIQEQWNYDFVETTLEQWDHKRGNFKMTAQVDTTLGQLKEAMEDWYLKAVVLPNFEVHVDTPNGVLILA